MQDKLDEFFNKLFERLPEEYREIVSNDLESPFERPYIQINNGVLEKYIADESGIVIIPEDAEVIDAGVSSWDGMRTDQYEYWDAENDQFIERIDIPASVKEIIPGAFSGVDALNEITVDPMCPAAVMIDGILFSGDKRRAISATSQMAEGSIAFLTQQSLSMTMHLRTDDFSILSFRTPSNQLALTRLISAALKV